jgi:O-Antigen ligase
MQWNHARKQVLNFDAMSSAMPSMGDAGLLLVTFAITLFVPDVAISESLHIGWEELLIPWMLIRLMWKRFYQVDIFVASLGYLLLVILLSILKNRQYTDVRNLFELYKVIKLGVLYVFACFVLKEPMNRTRLYRMLVGLFVALFLVNLLHLFNAFGINEWLIARYDYDGRDIAFFGLNSLGQPDARRIIGTMGNPNDNAILLLFFLACFFLRAIHLSKSETKSLAFSWNDVFIVLCALLIALCQSRTGVAVLLLVSAIGMYYARWHRKKVVLVVLLLAVLLALVNFLVDHHALTYVTNTSMRMAENNSFSARLKVWKELVGMWSSQPLLGYGPNKEFIYANNIYPENEYIFYLWRYGLLGLAGYCALLFGKIALARKRLNEFPLLVFLTLILSFTALTNNPLTNPKFVVIFALGWAWASASQHSQSVST